MKFIPFPAYQPRMNEWVENRTASALFCSPSMGKTVVTLKALETWLLQGDSRGCLIICPIRVASITWPNQIRQWDHSSWMRFAHLRTKEGMEAWHKGSAEIYLVNPEQLPKLVPLMFKKKRIPVDTIIFDEISLAKNPASVRFKTIRPYLPLFRQRIGLTGSPASNSYLDLFAPIRLLDDGERLGKSFTRYKETYFDPDGYMGYKFKLKPGAKERIDAKIADLALVMLGDDYLDVPTCSTIDIEVAMPPEGKEAYETLEKELLLELEKSDVVALTAAALATKLLQVTGGSVYTEDKTVHHIHDAKVKELLKLRKKHGKEPMLVLTAFRHESARVLAAIPGSRMFDEKDLGDWQRGEIHTWVADPRSLSHGIDGIQKGGRMAVWFTLTYSHETYMQSCARLVRTGQSNETIIYRLLIKDTIDWAVVEALRVKDRTQNGLLHALKALQQLHRKP